MAQGGDPGKARRGTKQSSPRRAEFAALRHFIVDPL
jgi:hypothetical protein